MNEHQNWQIQTQNILNNKAALLDEKHRKSLRIDFLSRAIATVPDQIHDPLQIEEFKAATELLIEALPNQTDGQLLNRKDYGGKLSAYKSMLMKKHGIVSEGYYTAIWTSLGISFGVLFGLLLKNLALGIALGVAIGVALGSGLNAKAQKQGKVL
jgi:hypothetical protein